MTEPIIKKVPADARDLPEKGVPLGKGSGRKKKFTEDKLVMLKRQIKKYTTRAAGQLRQMLPELAHLADAQVSITQKHLKMLSRVAALNASLDGKMKKRRMAFCNKYEYWTKADWSTFMYSDVAMFRCIRARRSSVRRPRFTVKTVKHPTRTL
jgi:hypothetical protein